ncbi:unnamed protein product, partial [Allacma fusca]
HTSASTTAQVFEDAGLVILTNAVVPQKPPVVWWRRNRVTLEDDEDYFYQEGSGVGIHSGMIFDDDSGDQFLSPELSDDISDPDIPEVIIMTPPKLRKHFPETWLWDHVNSTG